MEAGIVKIIRLFLVLSMVSFSAQADLLCGPPSDQTMSSVVRIVGGGVEGSGVVIAKDRVLTAAHVVEGMEHIEIVRSGLRRTATVISIQAEKDLALLSVDTGYEKPLVLSKKHFLPASQVWAVGYPLGGRQLASLGEITSYHNFDIRTTASVDHGQSGGALVGCDQGYFVLAGMVRAFGALERGGELVRLRNYSVSVRSHEIKNFLREPSKSAGLDETEPYQAALVSLEEGRF